MKCNFIYRVPRVSTANIPPNHILDLLESLLGLRSAIHVHTRTRIHAHTGKHPRDTWELNVRPFFHEVKNVVRMQNKLRGSSRGVSLPLCNRGDCLNSAFSPLGKFNSRRECLTSFNITITASMTHRHLRSVL